MAIKQTSDHAGLQLIKDWHGVALTGGLCVAIYMFQILHAPITLTLALAYIPLAYTTYHSGLVPGITAASVLFVSSLLIPGIDLNRAIQIGLAAYGMAIPMGILQSKGKFWDRLNGNLSKIAEIRLLTKFLMKNHTNMNPGLVYRLLDEIDDRAGNLEAVVYGWLQFRQEIDQTKAELESGLLQQAQQEMTDGRPQTKIN